VNILQYISRLDASGAARSGALLALGLARRGHRVRVACGSGGPLARELESGGVPVMVLPERRHRFDRSRTRTLLHEIESALPDLLHINNLSLDGPALAAVARRHGVPVAWHVREDPASRRARRLRRRLLARADVVIAVSREIQTGLAPHGSGTIVVVPNGIEPGPPPDSGAARRACGLDPAALWIGWLGRIVRRKGALDFLQAAAGLHGDAGPGRLILAGRPAADRDGTLYMEEIDRFQRERPGLEARVLRVPEPEALPRLVEGLDVLVVPSYWEGCSRVVLEGMRAARAIVAYDTGGTPEILRNGVSGLLVPAGDRDGLRAAILKLAGDEALRLRLGTAARAAVTDELSLTRHLDAMENLYDKMLRR